MLGIGDPFVILTKIGSIEMDASLDEDHRLDSIVTRNPIEDGSQYSDHIVLLPIVLELTCRVSDTSLYYFSIAQAGKEGRANQAYFELVKLQNNRKPFDVDTGIRVYENMVIENLSVPRNSKDGHSIRFNMVLVEIPIIGDNVKSNRELIAKDVRHSAIGSVSKGYVQKELIS